jgi:hypothetical protein
MGGTLFHCGSPPFTLTAQAYPEVRFISTVRIAGARAISAGRLVPRPCLDLAWQLD